MAGILAVRQVEHAARRLTREYVRQAREDSDGCHEIGVALGLSPNAARRGFSIAEAAYDEIAGDPDGEYASHNSRSFVWTCAARRAVMSDRGPCDGPADDERGHAHGCSRLSVVIAAWEAQVGRDGIRMSRSHRPAPRHLGRRTAAASGHRPDDKLTVDDICAELKISRSTFYDWRQKRRGPRCIRLPNGALRVRRHDFNDWLSGREII